METPAQASRPLQPEAAIDWRLLVPLTTGSRVLVAGIAAESIARSLGNVGADALAGEPGGTGDQPTGRPGGFDVAAVPLGFERAASCAAEATLRRSLTALRQSLQPGGTLILGFANPVVRRPWSLTSGLSLRPSRVVRALEGAGYGSVQVYGVLTDLATPVFVFPLEERALAFAVRQYLRHKVPRMVLGFATAPAALWLLSKMLPAYFVTGVSVPRDSSGPGAAP